MSPDFIGFQRAALLGMPVLSLDRHRWSIALFFVVMTRTAARPLDLRHRRQPDGRRSMPASMSAAPSSSPSASPGSSPGSAAISGSRATSIASVEVANGYELNIIAACVIGGISIAGGIGSVGGAVLGALFLGII